MSDLRIQAEFDDTRLAAQEALWRGRLRELNEDINKTSAKLKRTVRSAMSAISMTVTSFQSVAGAFGIAIPAAFQAVFSAITSTISSLTAIAAAYAAGGVTAYLTGIIEVAAIGLSVFGVAAALTGQEESQRALQRMNSALRSVGMTSLAWGRTISAWGE